jgi:hypothetical protein
VAGRTRPAPPRRLPTRSCVACRTARPKRELVRVVRTPEGIVRLDATGRAPGRGAYLCREASCWDAAGRRKALEHALGVSLPAELATIVAAGPGALAVSPEADSAPADGPRPDINPDPMTRGEAHGQE